LSRKLFIHANNVHHGGGRTLLLSILSVIPTDIETMLLVDSRMNLPDEIVEKVNLKQVEAKIIKRFGSEKWLKENVSSNDVVLCFGNLPPLFKLNGHVVLFVQNRYLVENTSLKYFSFKTKSRILIERIWLRLKLSNVNEVIVQTPSMAKQLQENIKCKLKMSMLPFMDNANEYNRGMHVDNRSSTKECSFLYVASGEPHKNHKKLLEAWCLLAKNEIFPSLKLTINETAFPELCDFIKQKTFKYNLKVDNLGELSPESIRSQYTDASAFIYPSTFESFGIPLIEARQAGLAILASELDYVRDVIDPEESFNPLSEISIAQAVKRFMGIEEQKLPLCNANEFIEYILSSPEKYESFNS
jgi:glycosyltransferase involved in cell wall biosynthesis